MPERRPTLLLTRPEAQSRRFATQFAAKFGNNWPIVIAPLQKIVAVADVIPVARELIFTSENAVAPLRALSPANGRRAWCVGARTAQVAAEAGFSVMVGGGNSQALVQQILAERPNGPLLHARGRHVTSNLAETLNSAGIETLEALVYDQISQSMPDVGIAALRGTTPLLVPVFSPRSAQLLADAASSASAPLMIAAISAAVTVPCAILRPVRLEVAQQPDAEGMLAALARLLAP